MKLKKLSSLFLALVLGASLLAGCSVSSGSSSAAETADEPAEVETTADEAEAEGEEEEAPEAAGGSNYVIGYAPTTMNNAFWLAVLDGVNSVLEPAGVEVITIDAQGDQATMNDQIGDLISAGIDALLVAPMDSTGVKSALQACADAGIPVVNFDTPVADTDLVESIIASDNYNAGVVVAEDMMGRLPEGSKVAVLHSPSGQACIDRADGFYDTIGDYFDVVQELDGQGDTGVSMPLAEDILQADPDLAAFFCVNDPSAIGAVQALAARPELDVLVYGVDGSPDAKAQIESGSMTGTGAQSPNSIGALSAQAALDILAGKSVDKEITVPTFLITADELAEYGVDGWQ